MLKNAAELSVATLQSEELNWTGSCLLTLYIGAGKEEGQPVGREFFLNLHWQSACWGRQIREDRVDQVQKDTSSSQVSLRMTIKIGENYQRMQSVGVLLQI